MSTMLADIYEHIHIADGNINKGKNNIIIIMVILFIIPADTRS